MRFGFYGSVLCHVLRECQHQAFAVVEDVYLLPLLFGEVVRVPHGKARHQCAQADEYQRKEPDLLLVSMFVNDLNSIFLHVLNNVFKIFLLQPLCQGSYQEVVKVATEWKPSYLVSRLLSRLPHRPQPRRLTQPVPRCGYRQTCRQPRQSSLPP